MLRILLEDNGIEHNVIVIQVLTGSTAKVLAEHTTSFNSVPRILIMPYILVALGLIRRRHKTDNPVCIEAVSLIVRLSPEPQTCSMYRVVTFGNPLSDKSQVKGIMVTLNTCCVIREIKAIIVSPTRNIILEFSIFTVTSLTSNTYNVTTIEVKIITNYRNWLTIN